MPTSAIPCKAFCPSRCSRLSINFYCRRARASRDESHYHSARASFTGEENCDLLSKKWISLRTKPHGTPRTTFHQARQPVQGQLLSVEADPKAVKVDSEGTAAATESKTRLLRPVIAALIATKSMDNDTGKQTASGTGNPNTAGRSLGGFSGFGLFGTLAARGPRYIGATLGFYGLAWSVYSNIISRGNEITFQKNTAITIQFGAPRKK